MAPALALSIVVPVGPGDEGWTGLLRDLAGCRADAELLLVAARDAMPPAFTPSDYGLHIPAQWLDSAAGRARQQNAGAARARGDTLWFLHADSRLSPETLAAAEGFAGQDALGYFDLRFRDDGPALVRLNALGARLRSRWLNLPFGDQGLMLPRRRFEAFGGFDERLECGEDHALVWAARRAGLPLVALGAPLWTSARRYAERGWLRTTLQHARLTIAQARRFSARGKGQGAA